MFGATSLAQAKYPSLLWEISGNGQKSPSYLYGTMHVSGRIAYHLGDEFFNAINDVDAIALESNPIIWLDEILNSPYASSYLGKYGISYQTYKGFYKEAFKQSFPTKKDIGLELSKDHYLSNWMLYRENLAKKNFEEDTFLDMFIYQAGSKKNKPVYSLEDFKQTTVFALESTIPDKEKKEYPTWYKDLTKEKSYYDLLENAYREQDLDFLDSLQRVVSSDNHMKYMLYERNTIMAKNIDSILRTGQSLFIGIGAAHLPMELGVIEQLRSLGYTVTSIKPTITPESKIAKESIDLLKKPLAHDKYFESDLFSVNAPCVIYETPTRSNKRSYFGPELTNGTFYTISEISTYNYLKSDQNFSLGKIDSLLFENIPGEVLSKKRIENNGYEGLDITNKTRTGDIQRYQIFLTPISILIFKVGGKQDFVLTNSDSFFSSIKLKKASGEWKNISTRSSEFKTLVPDYYSIKCNTLAGSLYDHPEIEAFDKETSTYFLIKRTSLHDIEFIEEDEFELKRLLTKYIKTLSIDSLASTQLSEDKLSISGIGKTSHGKEIKVAIHIKGAYYYLLVAVSDKLVENMPFFDDFTISTFSYDFPFEDKVDSSMNFKVRSNYLQPDEYSKKSAQIYAERKEENKKTDESYLAKDDRTSYFSENFEKIYVDYYKFHDYRQYEHVDSLWNEIVREFEKSTSTYLYDKKVSTQDQLNILEAYFADTNSSRLIRLKSILLKGYVYSIESVADKSMKSSMFIDEFYRTFTPLDNETISVLSDKPPLFFDAIYGTDSLKKSVAMKSVQDYIVFDDKHATQMMKTLSGYAFDAKEIDAKAQLIKDLGKLNHPEIPAFLGNLYVKLQDTAKYQLAVLYALGHQKNKKSTQQFLQLLNKDIPLSGYKWGNGNIFDAYYDTLSLTNILYPQLLNYTFVPAYKEDIFSLLSKAVEERKIKPKRYSKRLKTIVDEAKLELKRQISYEQSELAEESSSYYYSSYKNEGNKKLVQFATILLPFYEKAEVQDFFNRLSRVKDYEVQTDVACQKINWKISVSSDQWLALAKDPINRSYLYRKLNQLDRLDLFPEEFKNQELMAKAILYRNDFNFSSDSLAFLDVKYVETRMGDGYVYFFKSKTSRDKEWGLDYIGLQPSDKDEVSVNDTFLKKGIDLPKDKAVEEVIKEVIKEIEISGHPRATEKEDNYYSLFDY